MAEGSQIKSQLSYHELTTLAKTLKVLFLEKGTVILAEANIGRNISNISKILK